MRVTAVIPVHNRADLLQRLLESMRAQTLRFSETLVVDNASTDGAADLAEQSGCTVIRVKTNEGFARAVNRGWQAARGEWVAILNSDVELDRHWLQSMLDAVGNAGFAAGKILDFADPGRIDGTYDLVARSGCAWRAGHGERDQELTAGHGEPVKCDTTARPIAIAPATACLFRRDVLARVGGLEESFGSYLEDVDLGLRCLAADISGVYVPRAVALHRGSATLGRWNPAVVELIARNQVKLIARHYDGPLFRACFWPILVGQILWGIVALRHGAGGAWLRGKVEGLREFRVSGSPSPKLAEFLAASEQEIEERARDPYWIWYFRCAGRRPASRAVSRDVGRSDT